jgi:hypothetical protein
MGCEECSGALLVSDRLRMGLGGRLSRGDVWIFGKLLGGWSRGGDMGREGVVRGCDAVVRGGEAVVKGGDAVVRGGDAGVMDGEGRWLFSDALVLFGDAGVMGGEGGCLLGDALVLFGDAGVMGGDAVLVAGGGGWAGSYGGGAPTFEGVVFGCRSYLNVRGEVGVDRWAGERVGCERGEGRFGRVWGREGIAGIRRGGEGYARASGLAWTRPRADGGEKRSAPSSGGAGHKGIWPRPIGRNHGI